jgi:hypothetical protein
VYVDEPGRTEWEGFHAVNPTAPAAADRSSGSSSVNRMDRLTSNLVMPARSLLKLADPDWRSFSRWFDEWPVHGVASVGADGGGPG